MGRGKRVSVKDIATLLTFCTRLKKTIVDRPRRQRAQMPRTLSSPIDIHLNGDIAGFWHEARVDRHACDEVRYGDSKMFKCDAWPELQVIHSEQHVLYVC